MTLEEQIKQIVADYDAEIARLREENRDSWLRGCCEYDAWQRMCARIRHAKVLDRAPA